MRRCPRRCTCRCGRGLPSRDRDQHPRLPALPLRQRTVHSGPCAWTPSCRCSPSLKALDLTCDLCTVLRRIKTGNLADAVLAFHEAFPECVLTDTDWGDGPQARNYYAFTQNNDSPLILDLAIPHDARRRPGSICSFCFSLELLENLVHRQDLVDARHVFTCEDEARLHIALLRANQRADDAEIMLAGLEACIARLRRHRTLEDLAENGVRTARPGRPTGLWMTTMSSGFDFR